MSVFKCKMCGGTIEFEPGVTVGVCDSCGTRQTLPKTNDEAIANLFNRANNLRLKCEFDKAASIYEKIVEMDDSEAEAHWGIVLCKYGIEYVDDPASGAKMPTCHRTLFEAVTADADYQAAIDYSDTVQQMLYEAEAHTIDRIQKDILAIVKNEKPFDVFICYKETDESGKRTQDSVIANDIYYQLTEEGFKVFYAAITLEDKLGQEYEPYIFAALNSAKVMLVVGTNPMYFHAVWVKNEWSRYMKLMKTDRKKLLIPCYRDMDAYELPEEFAHLQAQDMSKIGFINDVVRGIKKVISAEASQKTGKETIVINSGVTNNASIEPLLERASLFLEDGKWQDADIYYEKVLDIDHQNAEAYLGKLMVELQVKNRKQLADCAEPFDSKGNYSKVLRFGDEKLEAEMRGYIAHIRERNELARLNGIYDNAQSVMQKAQSEEAFKKAASEFDSILQYKDAKVLSEKCREQAEVCRKQKEEAERLEAERISQTVEAVRAAIEKKIRGKSCDSLEDRQADAQSKMTELIALLEIFDEKQAELDATEKEKKTMIEEINRLQSRRSSLGIFAGKEKKEIDRKIEELNKKTGEFEERAQRLRNDFKGYTSKASVDAEIISNRKELVVLNNQIEEKKRLSIPELSFEQALKELKDGKVKEEFTKRYEKLYIIVPLCNAAVGETVIFGTYPQDQIGIDRTPISWKILAKEDNKILVLSEKALDCQEYNSSLADVMWESCSLRKWLNGAFLNAAFSAEEQAIIQSTTVSTDRDPDNSTNPGNATTDKVFLLSIREARKYFSFDEDRECIPTEYAIKQGAYTGSGYTKGGVGLLCWWWLRSPGYYRGSAAYVNNVGSVYYYGGDVNLVDGCVRPALWINLDD